MTILMPSLQQKLSLEQQKTPTASEAHSSGLDSTDGQTIIFSLNDFGRAILENQKSNEQHTEPITLSESEKEAAIGLDLSEEEARDRELLKILSERPKFKTTHTHTDARLAYSLPRMKRTVATHNVSLPVFLQDVSNIVERLEEKIEECEDLKEKLDQLSAEYVLACYRANHWNAMFELSRDKLKEWHGILIKETHLKKPTLRQ